MSNQRVSFDALQPFLPEGSLSGVVFYLNTYKIRFTVTRERRTVLGDYRHPFRGQPHRISVNGNLNPYAFLITFLHEVAHLLAYELYKNTIPPHGKEWKALFNKVLSEFLDKGFFPSELETVLKRSLRNPAASSCADETLYRELRKYDKVKENVLLLEQLMPGQKFKIKGGREFILGEKRVKRYKCKEVITGKYYLFSGLHEVKLLE